jgi:hypothetical protein
LQQILKTGSQIHKNMAVFKMKSADYADETLTQHHSYFVSMLKKSSISNYYHSDGINEAKNLANI